MMRIVMVGGWVEELQVLELNISNNYVVVHGIRY